jgi:CheY-like chemotaxis protein/HPt (histidine-containing phosphotransfer) domain-containing protein
MPSAELSGRRVLIVDDNESNRIILHHLVAGWGMVDDQAEDVDSAIRLIEQRAGNGVSYDVAIVDMLMPGKDGLQFAKEMKPHPVGSLIRLVILTSLIQRGHAELARQAGFVAYLTKPIRHDQLSNCLRTVLGLAQPASDAAQPRTITPAPTLITQHTMAEIESAPRILVVEDNLINQKLTVRMLEKLGYPSDVVGNGQEALEAIARRSYAVVLMDCQMPVIDGFEATRLIRGNEGRQRSTVNGQSNGKGAVESSLPLTNDQSPMTSFHIPIVALTANAMSGDRERCLATGMDDYLTKPVRKKDLKAVLDRWVPLSIQVQDTEAEGPEENRFSAEPATPPVIFDAATVLRNIGGDRDLLEQLAELFLQRYPVMMDNIRAALADRDHAAVEQAAHALKGTAGNLCASEVVLSAGQLEAIGRLGTLGEGPVIYTQLERAVLRLVHLLERRSRRQQEDRRDAA